MDAFEQVAPEQEPLVPDEVERSDRSIDYSVVPSEIAGIVLLDPFAVEPEPFNGRGLGAFVASSNAELIDDMRERGNTVPIRVRPRADGEGWTCPSGSRRVNAGRIIKADEPAFRVRAIIDAALSDSDAYALCVADNHGRCAVTALQQGREIKWAIENLYGGSRQAYLDNHATDKSVVSRALDLIALPEQILSCADDREALPTVFAEKLSPRLKDKGDRQLIMSRAKAFAARRSRPPSCSAT